MHPLILGFFLSLFIYFERETEHELERGRERRRERETIPGSLWAVSTEPDRGSIS